MTDKELVAPDGVAAPEGFDLSLEQSRQQEAALTGITGRDDVPETDDEIPIMGFSGDAEYDDDKAVEDNDTTPLEDI